MAVITAPNYVLGGDAAALTADHPVIGWRNVAQTIAADASDPNNPASNLLNPATHLKWRSPDNIFRTITPSFDLQEVDYIAFARHNLYSIRCPFALGYMTDGGSTYNGIIDWTYVPDDGPVLVRFNALTLTSLRMSIYPGYPSGIGGGIPQIATIYTGKLLTLPRKLYQGFAPINYGRVAKVTNGRSEAGEFLGRIVLQEFVKDSVPLSLISPTYFRDHIADFLIDSKERPFFFAWRPQSYPYEIGYCHMTNDPVPVNEAPHGLIAMQLEMTGVV